MVIEKAAFPGNKRYLYISVQRKRRERQKATFQILGQATGSHGKKLHANCPAVAAGDRGRVRLGFKIVCRGQT